MDILILNWKDLKNPDVGGAEIILYELAKRLVRDGHTVTWFCRSFPNAAADESVGGIAVVRRGNRFTVYWEAFRYYRDRKKKPDRVLDCVNTICWQTPLYIPPEKRMAYVNQLAREVLYYELPPVISHIAFALERLEYMTYRHTRFLCYSHSVADDIRSFGIPGDRIMTFPIGIDGKRYVPGKKSPDPLFVFVARLTPMKRPERCIDAMRIVAASHPSAKLALVGYGHMERKLTDRIRRLGLESKIFLVNKDHLYFAKHPKDQKVKLMQSAWALLLPSVKEGWGLVVTEAGACGTPSIVSGVTGLVDSVIDKETGIVLSSDPSSGELASAMSYIIENGDDRKKLSDGARAYAGKFTWEASYVRFASLL